MAMAGKPPPVNGLIELAKSTVSRENSVNEKIYQEEQERVFTRAWLFVGQESQIAKPGDYSVSSMDEESVILCTDRGEHGDLPECRWVQG